MQNTNWTFWSYHFEKKWGQFKIFNSYAKNLFIQLKSKINWTFWSKTFEKNDYSDVRFQLFFK